MLLTSGVTTAWIDFYLRYDYMSESAYQSLAGQRIRQHGIGELLARSAARFPKKTAIVYGDLRQTYAELDEAINRAANALEAQGVTRGGRVALFSHNNYTFVVLHFALARLGAISVPINFMLNAGEVAYILDHSGAIGIIAEETLSTVAEQAIGLARQPPTIKGVIPETSSRAPENWCDVSQWLRYPAATRPDIYIDDTDPIQIMYTSGTESRPKGAVLTGRNFLSQYVSCIIDGEMGPEDIELHALPLYHCAQLHTFLSPGLYVGSTNIILPAPEPTRILEVIERERISKLFCPPTVWISLLRHADFGMRDLSSLRKGYYGASIMPIELIKELCERLPALRLFNFYGQTEMSPLATVLKPEDQLRKLGSAGRPAINVETRVVDDSDQPVPPGTVGEIVHRGPHVMLGYWNDPEKTAEAFRNGWFHSGDLGVIDEDGYLSVVDRKKDMIKTGGENVASREVEEVLYQHAAVAEVAVLGIPHPLWMEAVIAAVVLRQGAEITQDGLISFCRDRLAGFKTPKRIVFFEHLPKNASGKILKRELREKLSATAAPC